MDAHEHEGQQDGRRHRREGDGCRCGGGTAQCGGGQQEHTYIEYEYETRFGAEGMDVREKEQQGRQVEEEDGSRQDEVLHGRREEQRQRRSGDECASRFRDRSEKLASGGPVDVAERESGQQQARNRDGDFAQRAPEKHDGQRQQDQERRCGRGDERQQSDVERGAEDGVEAESVAVRTAEILRGEGQQGRCGEGRQAVAADGEAAGDRSVERDGETGSDGVEVVAYGEAPDGHAREEHQQSGDPARPDGMCGLELRQQFPGGRDRKCAGGIPAYIDGSCGMAGLHRHGHGGAACVPHRDDGECGEGQEGRNERLPCDVEFHVGGFFSGQN